MADNVLWIVTDDQMRSTLRTMDRTWKRLVRKGVRFRNGYAAMPLCGPARASLLTGTYPHVHGCHTNNTHAPFVRRRLDRDTVATRMNGAGYATGYFGKYMNGLAGQPSYIAPGWERWVALFAAGQAADDTKANVDGDIRSFNRQRAADGFAASRLRRFIRRHREGRPWFAVLAPNSPHSPYTPSPGHRHDFDEVDWDPPAFNEPKMRDKPPWMRRLPPQDRDRMRRVLEGKLEELQDVDDQVGRVLNVLWRTGQLARTWIFFVSDNGYLLGEHRLVRKEQPYEESAGIPFVVRGPGVVRGVEGALVSQVDLMPTTLDIAGLDPDAERDLDGRSMLAPLTSGNWSGWRRRLLVENPDLGWALLREGSEAFIQHDRDGEWELYDLDLDPHQLANRRNADVRALSASLVRLRSSRGVTLRGFER